MVKRENILPFAPIGKLIFEATGKRVSQTARIAAADILEEVSERIVHKANLLADHSGRKTLKGKDIILAYNQLRGEL